MDNKNKPGCKKTLRHPRLKSHTEDLRERVSEHATNGVKISNREEYRRSPPPIDIEVNEFIRNELLAIGTGLLQEFVPPDRLDEAFSRLRKLIGVQPRLN